MSDPTPAQLTSCRIVSFHLGSKPGHSSSTVSPRPRTADVHVDRELVRKAEVSAAVAHQAERRLVFAPRVFAAAVLHVHHEGALVRQAEGGAGVAGMAIDWVARAAGLPADGEMKGT